jgi:aminoglycoside phosphotransferase family enzyme/predicted kinase
MDPKRTQTVRATGVENDIVTTSGGLAETHISTVFFTCDRAYKVLKPIDVGFADFRRTSERLEAIDREVELNRRLSPDVYLGTADVSENGELVDRMVVMRRLADDRRLEGLLLDPSLDSGSQHCLEEVVRCVARLHMDAAPIRGADAAMATSDAVRANWEDNFESIEGYLGEVIDADEFTEARELVRDYLQGCPELFEERIRSGWIRDGHGDLRAEDIFCEPDGPRILDCLAFSDELRISDVLADIGFLAMDLIHLGHPGAADALLDRYRDLTAETHPESLGHHYIAYRAHVRTKVCCLQYSQGNKDKAALARSLHRLALEQLRVAERVLVIVGGGPGTGKSTVARGLSDSEGLAYIGSDALRKELAGLAPSDRAGAAVGEGIYTPEMTERLYDEMIRRAELLLSLGEPVVMDASFTAESHRQMARELAQRRRVRLVELRCIVEQDTARDRVAAREDDPSDADSAVVDHLTAQAQPWPQADVLDTGRDVASVHAEAVTKVHRRRTSNEGE